MEESVSIRGGKSHINSISSKEMTHTESHHESENSQGFGTDNSEGGTKSNGGGVNRLALSALKSVRRRRSSQSTDREAASKTPGHGSNIAFDKTTNDKSCLNSNSNQQHQVENEIPTEFVERTKMFMNWECKNCKKTCIPIREESRCLCGHRLKAHASFDSLSKRYFCWATENG